MLPAQKRNEILMMPWVNSACITCMQFLNLRIRKLFKLLQVLIFPVIFESLSWNSFERACAMIQRCWNSWSQKDQSCTFGTWEAFQWIATVLPVCFQGVFLASAGRTTNPQLWKIFVPSIMYGAHAEQVLYARRVHSGIFSLGKIGGEWEVNTTPG